MKIQFLTILTIILIFGCTNPNVQRLSNEEIENAISKAKSSKLIVLDVYHNRCETCKHIEPVIEELKVKYFENDKVSFFKYDLSNPFTINDSMKIAKALGLEKIYGSQRYSGIVIFINTETKQVIKDLIAEYNPDKYIEVIENNI